MNADITPQNPDLLDKRRVRASFERAAADYDRVAVLQREVGQRMVERLDYIRLRPQWILDVGAGTGHCTKVLSYRYKRARITALDLAPNMLYGARRHAGIMARLRNRHSYVCGDAEQLPIADHAVDLVFSNLTLQWCNDLNATLRELRRVLKPNGLLMFSTFGPDTLKELRQCWSGQDTHNHVNSFIDMHDIGDALLHAAMLDPVMDTERLTLTYPDVYALMHDLKALGAHNATLGRPRGLTGKGRMQAVARAYEQFRDKQVLPATYEVIYGHAWAPDIDAAANIRGDGVVKVPLDQLRRPRGTPQ